MNREGHIPLGSIEGPRDRLRGEVRRLRQSLIEAIEGGGGVYGVAAAALVALAGTYYRAARFYEKQLRAHPDGSSSQATEWMRAIVSNRELLAATVVKLAGGRRVPVPRLPSAPIGAGVPPEPASNEGAGP